MHSAQTESPAITTEGPWRADTQNIHTNVSK